MPTPELDALFARMQARRPAVAAEGPRARRARLDRFAAAIERHRGALAAAMHADFGKPAVEVELTEVQLVLAELDHARRHLARWMRPRRVGTPPLLAGTRSEVRYEPRGVALILAPWNYPVYLLLNPLVAAVAAGNCAVVKPSEKTPATAEALRALLADAFDESEVAVVTGDAGVAEALLALPFDHVFFTGSTRVGRLVMAAAARHLASVTLELGGKSPAVVGPGADLRAAARRILWSKCINAGQTCIAPDYALVHRPARAAFVAELRAAMREFFGSPSPAPSGDVARIVDDAGWARLARLVDEAVAAGARIEAGGGRDAATRWLAPTVLTGVGPETGLMKEEIFGPILPVLEFDGWDDAAARIEALGRPLALYVFVRRPAEAEPLLRRAPSGGAVVNNVALHLTNPGLPFGGVGASGMGSYHGWYGFRAFSHERAVMRQVWPSAVSLFFPPYGARTWRLARVMRKLL
jgi:aldehyde dehydrogenase (NAD+)